MSENSQSSVELKLKGKVASFKGARTKDAFAFLQTIKTKSDRLWYVLIEKDENGFSALRYNTKASVRLKDFIEGLKGYYTNKYSLNVQLCERIKSIRVIGEDRFVTVENIPFDNIEGVSFMSIMMKDITELLSNDKIEQTKQ
jgi:hypothetical protein